jgi:hypothetical protein
MTLPAMQGIVEMLSRAQESRLQAEVAMHVKTLETQYALAKLDVEKTILLHYMDLGKHAFDRKVDFVKHTYDTTMAYMDKTRTTLLEKQQKLLDRRFDSSLSLEQQARNDTHLNDLNVQLIEINQLSRRLAAESNLLVAALRPLP